jgi:hypothetical protein
LGTKDFIGRYEDIVLKKTLLLVSGSQVLMAKTQKILERENYSVYSAVGIAGAREKRQRYIRDRIGYGACGAVELGDGRRVINLRRAIKCNYITSATGY